MNRDPWNLRLTHFLPFGIQRHSFSMAPSPSGKAEVCKISITSSNLVGASKNNRSAITWLTCFALG
jgi:hypothetical protein